MPEPLAEGGDVRGVTDRAALTALHREFVREAVASQLRRTFGPDNATRYEDEPNRIGISFADGVVIDVRIGDDPPKISPNEAHRYTVDVILHGSEPYPCVICGRPRQATLHQFDKYLDELDARATSQSAVHVADRDAAERDIRPK